MYYTFVTCVAVNALLLISCGQDTTPSLSVAKLQSTEVKSVQNTMTDSFPTGMLLNRVQCKNDPSISYALYLPSKTKLGTKFPVVFFFDSQARGRFPVEKYQALAERYCFILVGSNNSKNGIDPVALSSVIDKTLQDVLFRTPSDPKNLFTAGFSGGARVAIEIASQDNRIKGVIANSAGFDPREHPISSQVCFAGLVGNEDFNLNEMKNTQQVLNNLGNVNDLLIFNGKHDWAPVEEMDKAFLLLSLEGVRAKRLVMSDSILRASFSADEKQAAHILSGSSDVLTQAATCNLMIVYYHELRVVDKYRKRLEQIRSSSLYRTALDRERSEGEMEQQQQIQYAQQFREKDLAWWKAEVGRLNKENSNGKDKKQVMYTKRLLAYLSLAAFMNSNAALRQDALDVAEKSLVIYQFVDPSNSEWAYLFSILRMKQNSPQEAFLYLERAIKLGFSDVNRIRVQKEYDPLLNDTKFNNLLAGIKNPK
jgi:hypothetical protein